MEENNNKSFAQYTKEQLSTFRSSIQNMGTDVNNGTVEIPLGLTKGRKVLG